MQATDLDIRFATDRFLRDCGSTEPIRIQVESPGDPDFTIHEFFQPYILVGQHEQADLRLLHPDVSLRQLYIQLVNGRLYAVNLSSQIQTKWNDGPRRSGWISSKGLLSIGPFQLKVISRHCGGPSHMATQESVHINPTTGKPWEMELRSARTDRYYGLVDRDLTLIGNNEKAQVVIQSPSVSPYNCAFIRTARGFWVVDLVRNGFEVNGHPVRSSFIHDGDLLSVGLFRCKAYYKSPDRDLPAQVISNSNTVIPVESSISNGTGTQPEIMISNSVPGTPLATNELIDYDRLLGPIMDHFTLLQTQTFEQFQELVSTMLRMFNAVLGEHRDHIHNELTRFERTIQTSITHQPQQGTSFPEAIAYSPDKDPSIPVAHDPAAGKPEPTVTPTAVENELHLWFQKRLENMNAQRSGMWTKLFGKMNNSPPPSDSDR